MKHINPERLKITLPAGTTPEYFGASRLGVSTETASRVAPVDGGNEWTVTGVRPGLVHFANTVAAMHYSAVEVNAGVAR